MPKYTKKCVCDIINCLGVCEALDEEFYILPMALNQHR